MAENARVSQIPLEALESGAGVQLSQVAAEALESGAGVQVSQIGIEVLSEATGIQVSQIGIETLITETIGGFTCYFPTLAITPSIVSIAAGGTVVLTTPGVIGGVDYGTVTYTWTTTAGVIVGAGLTATLTTTGVPQGTSITVTVTATSSLGCVAVGTATVLLDDICIRERTTIALWLLGRNLARLQYSPVMIENNLLRGQRDVAVQALAFHERATQRLSPGVDAYSLPTDYITTWALHVAQFSVGLRIYDASGMAWYLIVSAAGDASFTALSPSLVLGSAQTIQGLQLTDSGSNIWYISPSVAGAVLISASNPGGAIQTSPVQLRDVYGSPWYLTVTTTPTLVPTATGTAVVSGADYEPKAMLYTDPVAFERLDPRLISPFPLYYTVYPNKQMRLYPTPTAVYDLVHYYFGDGLLGCDVPEEFSMEIIWHAVALAKRHRRHLGGHKAALEAQRLGMERLAPLFFPGHDSLDNYPLPGLFTKPQQG